MQRLKVTGGRCPANRLLPAIAGAVLCLSSLAAAAQDATRIPDRLVVATSEVPPFAMKDEHGNWTGINIDLLQDVKTGLEQESGHEIAIEYREMSLTELLSAVERGDVDLGAAAIAVDYEREQRMDFSHPFHSSGLGIAVRTRSQRRGWVEILEAIFSARILHVIAGMLAAIFVSGLAVYLFERRSNREHFGDGVIRGILSGIWWAAVTLTTVGYGDKVPRTVAGRLIGMFWMFTGLLIVASFTAAVASSLTVTQLKSHIAGPSDLRRVRVASVEGSTAAEYLESHNVVYSSHPDIDAALASLSRGETDAVVGDEPVLRHEVHQRPGSDMFVLPVMFRRQEYAFALPANSPLREPISQIVLRTTADPEWRNVLAGYLGEDFEG